MTRLNIALLPTLFYAALGNERVLLRDVQVLTLRRGEYTRHRRVPAIPQMTCVRGCDTGNTPNEMQCRNVGFDGIDVNWRCEATLPAGDKLSNVNVQCEGYAYPDDPYILAGSCGASYHVIHSHDTYSQRDSYGHRGYSTPYVSDYSNSEWSWGSIIMLSIVGYVFYNIFCGTSATSSRGVGSGSNPASYTSYSDTSYSPHRSSWYPWNWGSSGFFSGLGLGSVLGSMWSRGGYGWGRRPTYGYNSWYNPRSYSGYGGGGWFGGGAARSPMASPSSRQGRSHVSTSYSTTSRR